MAWRALALAVLAGMIVLATATMAAAQDSGYPLPTEGETLFPSPPPSDPPSDPPIVPPTDPPSDPPAEPPVVPPADPPFDPPAEPPFDPPTLANTGIPLTTAATVAGLLVLGGAGLVGMARRRRQS